MTRVALCTQAQVIQTANFSSIDDVGGKDVVTEAIDEADIEVFEDYGDPLKRTTFSLDSDQADYEFWMDNTKTYRIDHVYIIDGDNNRTEYTDGTASEDDKEYTKDLEFNKITFHADTIAAYSGDRVMVEFVPDVFHILARTKAALFLQDKSNVVNANEDTPSLALRFIQRIKRIEDGIKVNVAFGSGNERFYDPTYGEVIPQRRFFTY